MAIFPGAISTDSDLYIAVNTLSALLTDNPLTIGATTVNVNSTTLFPNVGFISIDAEIIKYTGKTATSFTGCTRGADGSTAATHSLGAQVDHNVVAAHHNVLKDEVIATEQFISDIIGRDSAQLKAPNGSVSAPGYSFASDPDSGIFTVAPGNLQFAINGTEYVRFSSAVILLTNSTVIEAGTGTASLPPYTFNGDTDTGIYRVGANHIGFATGATLRWQIDSSGNLAILGGGAGQILAGAGSVSVPAYSFNVAGATDTGIYQTGTGSIRFTSDGTNVVSIVGTGLELDINGSAATPSINWGVDPDTGIYRAGTNNLGFATNGILSFFIDSSQNICLTATKALYLDGGFNTYIAEVSSDRQQFVAGGIEYLTIGSTGAAGAIHSGAVGGFDNTISSAGNTAVFYAIHTDNTTGTSNAGFIARSGGASGGDPLVNFNVNGVTNWSVGIDNSDSDAFVLSEQVALGGNNRWRIPTGGQMQMSDGSAGAPQYSFINDTDTGIYRSGSNVLAVSLGGTLIFDFNPTVNRTFTTFQPSTDNAFTLGSGSSRWTTVFATTGTINTSHSSTKQNIEEINPENFQVPEGVFYDRDGRRHMGYLNDSLPDVARPFDEKGELLTKDNYENAVIGILCAAVRKLQKEVASLKN